MSQQPIIGYVNVIPGRTCEMFTTPGQKLVFLGGRATLRRPEDLVFCLRREDMRVEVVAAYMDWLPARVAECGEQHAAAATIVIPPGWTYDREKNEILDSPAMRLNAQAAAIVAAAEEREAAEQRAEAAVAQVRATGGWTPFTLDDSLTAPVVPMLQEQREAESLTPAQKRAATMAAKRQAAEVV